MTQKKKKTSVTALSSRTSWIDFFPSVSSQYGFASSVAISSPSSFDGNPDLRCNILPKGKLCSNFFPSRASIKPHITPARAERGSSAQFFTPAAGWPKKCEVQKMLSPFIHPRPGGPPESLPRFARPGRGGPPSGVDGRT